MYVLDRTAILCPPRTGSRSVRETALRLGWAEHNGHHGLDDDALRHTDERLCMVRNPYDTLASWYTANRNTAYPTIGAWVRHWYPREVDARTGMGRYVRRGSLFARWLEHATVVLHFEDYAGSFARMFGPAVQPPHVTDPKSVRNGRHYRDLYDDDSRELVESIFGQEAADLGYSF